MEFLFDLALKLMSNAPMLIVGIALGAWGYRYVLKKNPALIEKLAQEINAKTDAVRDAVTKK